MKEKSLISLCITAILSTLLIGCYTIFQSNEEFQVNNDYSTVGEAYTPNANLSTGSILSILNTNYPHYNANKFTAPKIICFNEVDFPTISSNIDENKVDLKNHPQDIDRNNNETYVYQPLNLKKKQVGTSVYKANAQYSVKTVNNDISNPSQLISTSIFSSGLPAVTTSNPFIANNNICLSADLTTETAPMFIGPSSNPGEPGVPVGDGMWILMCLLIGYGTILGFKLKSTL